MEGFPLVKDGPKSHGGIHEQIPRFVVICGLIREERVNIQSFLDGLLENYRNKIKFVDPQTLD